MSEYSVDAAFDAWVATLPAKHWAKYDISACRLGWEAQKAERIEVDESAVPVAKIRHFDYHGIARNGFSQEAEMLDGAPDLPNGTLLYTHPPAQAVQVDHTMGDLAHRDAEPVEQGEAPNINEQPYECGFDNGIEQGALRFMRWILANKPHITPGNTDQSDEPAINSWYRDFVYSKAIKTTTARPLAAAPSPGES